MHTFKVYYENADTDDPRKYMDIIQAETMGNALQKASEYYEIPSHDLVAVELTGLLTKQDVRTLWATHADVTITEAHTNHFNIVLGKCEIKGVHYMVQFDPKRDEWAVLA